VGPPMPGVGAPAQLLTATNLQKIRRKESFTLLTTHIADEDTRTILGDPTNPCFGRGDLAYAFVMGNIIVEDNTSDVQDMTLEWYATEIATDIGSDENTVRRTLVHLQVMNSERPIAARFSDDQITEKILTMIRNASSLLFTTAQNELNAVEGVPGQPGVRQFQLAAPPAPPAVGGVVPPAPPRPRDLHGAVAHFHTNWRDGVRMLHRRS
jgi:hypothetical protein